MENKKKVLKRAETLQNVPRIDFAIIGKYNIKSFLKIDSTQLSVYTNSNRIRLYEF